MSSSFEVMQIVLLLLCWICRVAPQCNVGERPPQCQEPDSLGLCDPTSAVGNYSLILSSTEYASSLTSNHSSPSAISVRVGMTECPVSFDSPGPKWYKLESISELTSEPVGSFDEPLSRSEARLCEGGIIFSSCEPFVLDLPRTYGWNVPKTDVGNICFRLTILKDGLECMEQVSKCISPDSSSSSTMVSSGDEDIGSGEVPEEEKEETVQVVEEVPKEEDPVVQGSSGKLTEQCYTKWNCTNKPKRDFCVTDGITYPSRCAFRLQKCLTRNENLEIRHKGTCSPPTTLPPTEPTVTPYCWNDIDIIPWKIRCSSDGTYKPVQCSGDRCWCSSLRGFQTGTEIGWTCTDPDNYVSMWLKCLPKR